MPSFELPLVRSGQEPIIPVCIHVSAARFDALGKAKLKIPPPFIGQALIDTGASCTVIDHAIVDRKSVV